MPTSFTPETSLIFAAARRAASNEPIDFNTPDTQERRTTLEAELEWLCANSDVSAAVVRELFPAGVPFGVHFYTRIESFCNHLGFAEPSEKIGTQVWIAALRLLALHDAETLLLALAQTGHSFFRVHEGLPAVVEALSLPPWFAAEWFPALVTRLGDDQATAGVWGAIARYCEVNPSAALDAADALGKRPESDIAMRIAAEMLGTLRSVTLEPAEKHKSLDVDGRLARSASPAQRHCSLRSWVATASRGSLDIDELEVLLGRCDSSTAEDRAEGLAVVCRIACAPALSDACLLRALAWLQNRASPDLPVQSKHLIAVTINAVAVRSALAPDHPEADLSALLNKILPIAPECLGTWSVLERFLIKQMDQDKPRFEQTLKTLGERSPGVLYPLLRADKVFTVLLSKLAGQSDANFVARSMFESDIGARELGLGLFERLGLNAFPAEILNAVDENDLRITLFVFRALGMHGDVIARFLAAVAPRFQETSEDAKQDFADEVFVQCKNYPNACLAALKQWNHPPELIRAAVEKAEHYFSARDQVRTSPLNAMQIPFYRRHAERKWRTLQREIHDQAEEQSVFAQFMKNVEILYGSAFSSYDEAHLSDATPMGEHSFEFEFPRLEFVAPEDMALRRWHALEMIRRLGKTRSAQ
jgi:hypothetical protein